MGSDGRAHLERAVVYGSRITCPSGAPRSAFLAVRANALLGRIIIMHIFTNASAHQIASHRKAEIAVTVALCGRFEARVGVELTALMEFKGAQRV